MNRKYMVFKSLGAVIIAMGALLLLSCGDASVTGYKAPYGSKVELPEDWEIKTNTAVDTVVDVYVTDEDGNPLNEIQLQLGCFMCTIYDKVNPDGGPITSNDSLQAVNSPYIVKTTDSGYYEVVVRVQPPTTYSVDEYEAQFWASIGVDNETVNITVSKLD